MEIRRKRRRWGSLTSDDDLMLVDQLLEAYKAGDCERIRSVQADSPERFSKAISTWEFRYGFIHNILEVVDAVISTFVSLGVDLHRRDNQENSKGGVYPLEKCILGENFQRAKLLLELGANPNVGRALSYACVAEPKLRIPMAALLIQHGVDVNQDNPNIPGYKPILQAMDSKDPALVEFLISKGAVMPEIPVREEIRLDLDTFQARLEEACTKCWQEVQAKFPDEKFCLFGLETDSDFVIINPLFDSEGAIDRDSKKRRGGKSYVARISLDSDSEFYRQGEEHLDRLSAELNSQYGTEESPAKRKKRIKRLAQIFEGALKKLDQTGLFGHGAERDRIILMVSIIDADDDEWNLMLEIAERLNPKNVYEAFRNSLVW